MRTPTLKFLALTILMLIFSINNKAATHSNYLNNCANLDIRSNTHKTNYQSEYHHPGDTTVIICSNETPFVWNGKNYFSTGIYIDTLTNSQGGDSIVMLDLTVNFVFYSATTIITCTQCVPFTWFGEDYWTTGIYHDTLTSSNGCDSIGTLYLTVNPHPDTILNIKICDKQAPFVFNGKTYFASGSYYDTLVGPTGNDSIVMLNLTITVTPIIGNLAGPDTVDALVTTPYIVSFTNGCFYWWTATNGTILGGQGTNNVSIRWDVIGPQTLKLLKVKKNCSDSLIMNVLVTGNPGIQKPQYTDNILQVAPNPTNSILNLHLQSETESKVTIAIYDSYGKMIQIDKDRHISSGETIIRYQTSNWKKGVYYIRVITEDKNTLTQKVILL